MTIKHSQLSRRKFLGAIAAGTVFGVSGLVYGQAGRRGLSVPPQAISADSLARDEDFWREVAGYYDRTEGIVNLEHGYWGKMAHPVQNAFIEARTLSMLARAMMKTLD